MANRRCLETRPDVHELYVSGRSTAVVALQKQSHEKWPGEFMTALALEARQRGWRLLDLEFFGSSVPKDIRIDGAFIHSLPGDPSLDELGRACRVMIRLGNLPHPEDAKLPAVVPDVPGHGMLAAQHFAERGFRHIGFVGRDPWGDFRVLYETLREKAEALGMETHLLQWPPLVDDEDHVRKTENRRRMFAEWIRAVPKPFGLLALKDRIAAGYCEWARAAGQRLPTDVAVLGRGNDEGVCESSFPRLSVDDVANQLGVKRRTLERAFREELHRGVNAEFRRRRLERCCDLLRDTDLSVTDIAAMVGFRSDDYFYRAFKAYRGLTPRRWRLEQRAG